MISFPEFLFSLTSGRKARALGSSTQLAQLLAPALGALGRFPTAGQGSEDSGNEIGSRVKRFELKIHFICKKLSLQFKNIFHENDFAQSKTGSDTEAKGNTEMM